MSGGPSRVSADNCRHTDGRSTWKLVFPPAEKPKGTGLEAVRNYLRAQAGEFGIAPDLSDVELVATQESLLGTHYRFQQTLNNLPVEAGDLVVSVRRDNGQVYQVYNNTFPITGAPAVPVAAIRTEAALDAAWNHLRVHGKLMANPGAKLVYVSGKGGLRLVHKTYVATEAPFGYWEHHIDATSGEVVSVRDTAVCGKKSPRRLPDFAAYKGVVWSRAKTTSEWQQGNPAKGPVTTLNKTTVDGSALVFDGDPRTYLANAALVDASSAASFNAAYVTRTLRQITESNGTYFLEGPWVKIANIEAPATAPSTTTNGQWTAKRGNNAFNDAMVYFHIDQNQRYIQSLGFAGVQSNSITADSDGVSGDDNSYYLPGPNQISFGHGGVDDDEDADVILHEYGHAITYSIVPSWGAGDSGALGEGFGDYWGASYSSTTTNGTTFHPEWAFSWDGHSADTWTGRFMDKTNLTYDPGRTYVDHETINGIANYSDQLWSTPLFQAFLALRAQGYPRTDMDKIVLQAHFGIGSSPTMRTMANAIVNAAGLLFPAGPHAAVFQQKFMNQLILPPPAISNAIWIAPVGGQSYRTGAVAQLQWNRNNAPPAAAARLQYSTGTTTNYYDAMESGINGWTVTHSGGSLDWAQVTSSSRTPTHSWFAPDQTAVTDQYLRSPLLAIPANAVLSFWHKYALESGYDGGVVEASLNGTTWTDIGTSATLNGYNATIATSYSSPIAGRQAFSGTISSFLQTQIPLTAYAGQNIYLRFRLASDSSVAVTGWWVDDVSVIQQWIPIATTATNVSTYAWTVPATLTTNCVLRIQQFASGATDSAWVQSSPFTLSANPPVTSISLSNLIRLGGGAMQLNFSNAPGAAFTVLGSTNLTRPLSNWTALGTATEVSPGWFQFNDAQATNNATMFYRVRSP